MLTDKDIEIIKEARDEIQRNRYVPVTVIGELISGKHPITGEPIKKPVRQDLPAIVSEVSVRTALDRRLHGGIKMFTGDIIADIDIDLLTLDNDDIHFIDYDDKNYTVLAAVKIGLGEYNRVEIIGRLTE